MSDIEWKCLGDEYLLIRGNLRKVVSSDLWWSTIRGASPTGEELEQLWRQGLTQRDVDNSERRTADYLALVKELESYIKETEAELATARTDAAKGEGSREEVRRLESTLDAAREQLRTVRGELRGMVH